MEGVGDLHIHDGLEPLRRGRLVQGLQFRTRIGQAGRERERERDNRLRIRDSGFGIRVSGFGFRAAASVMTRFVRRE